MLYQTFKEILFSYVDVLSRHAMKESVFWVCAFVCLWMEYQYLRGLESLEHGTYASQLFPPSTKGNSLRYNNSVIQFQPASVHISCVVYFASIRAAQKNGNSAYKSTQELEQNFKFWNLFMILLMVDYYKLFLGMCLLLFTLDLALWPYLRSCAVCTNKYWINIYLL